MLPLPGVTFASVHWPRVLRAAMARYLASFMHPPLAVNKEVAIAGVPCHVFAQMACDDINWGASDDFVHAAEASLPTGPRFAGNDAAASRRGGGANFAVRSPAPRHLPVPAAFGLRSQLEPVGEVAERSASNSRHGTADTAAGDSEDSGGSMPDVAAAAPSNGGSGARGASPTAEADADAGAASSDMEHATVATTATVSTSMSGSSSAAPGTMLASLSPSHGVPPSAVPPPKFLLYIHGGGFIGSSYSNDGVFLSKLASQAPLVVVYIHYSLSPEVRYPTALNQCVAVYKWLRARSPHVVVAGESAGGNLSAALVLRCLAEGIPVPSALALAYPALELNPSLSPSRALHINDPLVPVNLLLNLAAAYLPEGEVGKPSATFSPFLHPLQATDDMLR